MAVITATPLFVFTLKVLVALPVASEMAVTGLKEPYIGLSIVNITLAPCIAPADTFDTMTVMIV